MGWRPPQSSGFLLADLAGETAPEGLSLKTGLSFGAFSYALLRVRLSAPPELWWSVVEWEISERLRTFRARR